MKELVGKIISKVELSDDTEFLAFTTIEGEVISYRTWGDCCSVSWFSHINGFSNLIGSKVLEVTQKEERVPTDAEEAEGDYEVLAIYAYTIKTEKGYCDIEFRNDSNGYYGGWCDLASGKTEQMTVVTGDI